MSPRRSLLVSALILSAPFLILNAKPAYAYLDPGAGSLVWQIVIASGLSALYFIKTYWQRIKQILGMESTSRDDEDG